MNMVSQSNQLIYPTATLIEMLEERARELPNDFAIQFLDSRGNGEKLNYSDLFDRVAKAANTLHKAGIQPAERVVIILPTSVEFLETFFGLLMIGAVPVPFAPPFSAQPETIAGYEPNLRKLLLDSNASACVIKPKLQLVLSGTIAKSNAAIQILSPVWAKEPLANSQRVKTTADDLALLQYTSGSTNSPKGVALANGNLIANVDAIYRSLYHPDAVTVSWLPLYHDMGLIGSLLTSLYAKVPLVLLTPLSFLRNPVLWLRALSENRGTITVAPNFAFGYCLKRIKDKDLVGLDLSPLNIMLNGAEPVDPDLVERFEERFASVGLKSGTVCPVYGLAESTLAVAFSEPGPLRRDVVDAEECAANSKAVAPTRQDRPTLEYVSVGKPIFSQEICIVDNNDTQLAERNVGEICVRGASVMQGYFQNAEATETTLRNGWLHTGDSGYIADGHLYISGRIKDVIIRHGKNYYPHDMEFSVAAIDGVRKGSVVAFGDTVKDDTQLVIVIETVIVDDDARKALDQAIRTTIFNNFNLPVKEVVLLSPGGVPKTTSGKIQRQSCKKQYLNDELGQSIVLPRYWLAQRLAQSVASIIRNRVQRVVHLKIDRLRRFANLNQYKAAE